MSKILTIFGATGTQGGSVIDAVRADPALSKEYTIRGVTRDVTKPAAKALADKGVQMVSVSCRSSSCNHILRKIVLTQFTRLI
jgi:2-keto-3-deoxy-6-phosphogluconate aldolase